jgi:hypothetical protein
MPKIELETFVDAAAAVLKIEISDDHRPGVIENFTRISQVAQLVMEFPLDAELEPAPVFTHVSR